MMEQQLSVYQLSITGRSRPLWTHVNAAVSVFQHPNYGQGPGFTPNDIAVVASNNIQGDPTGGNVPADATNPETRGWITGWGRTCGELLDLTITAA